MRILVVSNLYPPYFIGGYELGCKDVVTALKARGHDVKVLTSTYGVGQLENDGEIYRWLEKDVKCKSQGLAEYIVKVFQRELDNQNAFKSLCFTYKPDLIYIWNLRGLSVSIAFLATKLGFPIVYFVFDDWLSCWESDPWYSLWNRQPNRLVSKLCYKLLLPLLKRAGLFYPSSSLDLLHVQFASQYLKQSALQAGKPVEDAKVIYWGIDVNNYSYKEVSLRPKRLLYVGQIVPHKGVHTSVEALKVIVDQPEYKSVTLTIAGGTIVPNYKAYIQNLVHSLGLESNVYFTGFLHREALAHIYQEHDILIFPSVWDEPFGITLLEGMSSKLAVVATATGGSSEILEDGVNALIFPKENAEVCATQILRLMQDLELFDNIRENGRRTVIEKFSCEMMMDKIEKLLYEAVVKKSLL